MNQETRYDWKTKRKEAAAYIQSKCDVVPQIGLILGSGLGALAGEVTDATVIPYSEIPHFPPSTVAGHAGEMVIGNLEGKRVIAMNGRFHYYEGHSMQQLALPVWTMRTLGASVLIATNAAGGVNRSFRPGDLMIIVDHINMMYDNPLIGPNDDELGVRFPSMGTGLPVGDGRGGGSRGEGRRYRRAARRLHRGDGAVLHHERREPDLPDAARRRGRDVHGAGDHRGDARRDAGRWAFRASRTSPRTPRLDQRGILTHEEVLRRGERRRSRSSSS